MENPVPGVSGAQRTTVVLSDLTEVFRDLVSQGKVARDIYTRLLDETTYRYGWTPNGAELVEIVKAYNNSCAHAQDRLPVGSASVSREAASDFQQALSRSYRQRLPSRKLPDHLLLTAGSLFDSIVESVRTEIDGDALAQIESIRRSCADELAAQVGRHTEALHQARMRSDDFEAQLATAHTSIDHLNEALTTERVKVDKLVSDLDDLGQRYRNSHAGEAVAKASLASLTARHSELTEEFANLRLSSSAQRKEFLLSQDRCRQLELSLATERVEHRAAKSNNKKLEGDVATLQQSLREVKDKADQLTAARVQAVRPTGIVRATLRQSSLKSNRRKL